MGVWRGHGGMEGGMGTCCINEGWVNEGAWHGACGVRDGTWDGQWALARAIHGPWPADCCPPPWPVARGMRHWPWAMGRGPYNVSMAHGPVHGS